MIHLYVILETGIVHRVCPNPDLAWNTAGYDALVHRHSLVEGPVSQYLVLDDALEPDHYFFEAWCLSADESGIDVDMTKARLIHLAEIRKVRNAELAALDIPWMMAIEEGDTNAHATITRAKQVLRDIPQTFDLTTNSPEALKALWPEGLSGREGVPE